jgi:hypothetical protein
MEIQRLLEKFYAGDSTPEEEHRLKDYFLHGDGADAQWAAADRKLFRALCGEAQAMPEGVSTRLEATLRRLAEAERRRPSRTYVLWRRAGGIAAAVLLCAGLFFMTRPDGRHVTADTYDSPEEAALMAEKTLLYVSAELNRGIKRTSVVGYEMGKMNEVLEKTFKTNITEK